MTNLKNLQVILKSALFFKSENLAINKCSSHGNPRIWYCILCTLYIVTLHCANIKLCTNHHNLQTKQYAKNTVYHKYTIHITHYDYYTTFILKSDCSNWLHNTLCSVCTLCTHYGIYEREQTTSSFHGKK